MSVIKQTMTVDAEGFLLTSCDTIFDTTPIEKHNFKEEFPFLESVFSELQNRLELGRVIYFPKVETKHSFLSGFYDYSFKLIKIKNNQWGIQWEIVDVTETYEKLKQQQQIDHEDHLKDQ